MLKTHGEEQCPQICKKYLGDMKKHYLRGDTSAKVRKWPKPKKAGR